MSEVVSVGDVVEVIVRFPVESVRAGVGSNDDPIIVADGEPFYLGYGGVQFWRVVEKAPKKKTVADFKVGDTIEGDDYQLDWPTGTHVMGLSTRLTRAGSRWITEYDYPAPPTAFEYRRTIQFIPGR